MGSFWRTFGFHTVTAIETILEKDSYTLEELLDEEECLQEVKSQNKKLIDYLSGSPQLSKLVQYLTNPEEDGGGGSEKTRRYSFLACEILVSEVWSITEAVYQNESFLERLFAFLHKDPPLNPVHTSYLTRVAGVLLQRKPLETVQFLRKQSGIIDRFLIHLGNATILELLIKISMSDSAGEKPTIAEWLQQENYIQQLIDKLDANNDPVIHEHASQALVELVRKATNNIEEPNQLSLSPHVPTQAEHSALVEELETQEILVKLMSRTLQNGGSSTLLQGVTILVSLLQKYANEETPPPDPVPLLNIIVESLPKFVDFLKLSEDKKFTMSFGSLSPLGFHRLRVVEFFVSLVETKSAVLESAIIECGALPACLDLFFSFPWNNFLHQTVEQLVKTILEGESSDLKMALFTQANLANRIVDANKDVSEPSGYLGFLTNFASFTTSTASTLTPLQELLDAHSGWQDYINGRYNDIRAIETKQLGGHKPLSLGDNTSDEEDDLDFDDKGGSAELVNVFTQYLVKQGFSNSDFPEELNDPEDDYDDDGEVVYSGDDRLDAQFPGDDSEFVYAEQSESDEDFDSEEEEEEEELVEESDKMVEVAPVGTDASEVCDEELLIHEIGEVSQDTKEESRSSEDALEQGSEANLPTPSEVTT